MSVEVDGGTIIVAGEDAAPIVPTHIEGSLTDVKKLRMFSGQIAFSQADRRYVYSTHHGGHASQKVVPIDGEKKIVEITADYTVDPWDDIIIVDAGSNTVDVTLLPLADALNRPIIIIDYDNTNAVTVNADGTEQIRRISSDTDTSIVMNSAEILKLIPATGYWQILQDDF